MSNPTRRTHIVRIKDDTSGKPNDNKYVDIEVLDAIAFRIEGGKEVILKLPAKDADPYIVDDVGSHSEKAPGNATRRSHMAQIGSGTTAFYIEKLDAVAYRDTRSQEWILKMPADSSVNFNQTDGGGASGAGKTRRTHSEKIFVNNNKSGDFVTVERCDAISFRHVRNEEVIIKCPSFDDGNGARASTIISNLPNYDPTDDKVEPPSPEEFGDKNVYFKFKPGYTSLNTGKEKISCGPLWWIRKIKHQQDALLYINVLCTGTKIGGTPGEFSVTINGLPYGGGFEIMGRIDRLTPTGAPTSIVNPVTDAMIANYDQWSTAIMYEKRANQGDDNPSGVYYPWLTSRIGQLLDPDIFVPVTADNAGLVIDESVDQCGNPVSHIGQFATFFTCDPTTQAAAIRLGFDVSRLVNFEGTLEDVTYYVNAANTVNASFPVAPGQVNDSTWSVAFFPGGQDKAANTITQQSDCILNLSAIKAAVLAQLTPGATPPDTLTITFDISGESGDPKSDTAEVTFKAQAFAVTRDFPLSEANAPNFTLGGDADPEGPKKDKSKGDSVSGDALNGATVTMHIDLTTFDVAFDPLAAAPPPETG